MPHERRRAGRSPTPRPPVRQNPNLVLDRPIAVTIVRDATDTAVRRKLICDAAHYLSDLLARTPYPCARCGRPLTAVPSILRGTGPVCARLIGGVR